MKKKILKLLYRSLDSPLGDRDRRRLEKSLEEDAELRRTRDDLLDLREGMAAAGAGGFRAGFAERTIDRARREGILGIAAEEDLWHVVPGVARRFALAGVIIVVAAVSYLLINQELLPHNSVYYVSDLSLTHILKFPVF